jgi:hypothetical protein
MQLLISSPLASIIQQYGFKPVCFAFAFLPLCSWILVHLLIPDHLQPNPVTEPHAEQQVA